MLAVLALSENQVVKRDRLRREFWSEKQTTDGINRCIKQIRSALRDNARSAKYVKTLPGEGYLFIVPVLIERERREFTPRALTKNSFETLPTAAAMSPGGSHLAYADSTGLYLQELSNGETHFLSSLSEPQVFHIGWFSDSTKPLMSELLPSVGRPRTSVFAIRGGYEESASLDAGEACVSSEDTQIAFTNENGDEIWTAASHGEMRT